MRIASMRILVFVIILFGLLPTIAEGSTRAPSPPMDKMEADKINLYIVAAHDSGNVWVQSPGGIAWNVFGSESKVLGKDLAPAWVSDNRKICQLVFKNIGFACDPQNAWFVVTLKLTEDGTWLVSTIEDCPAKLAAVVESEITKYRQMNIEATGFDYTTQGPLDLLSLLKKRQGRAWLCPPYPDGWVRYGDLSGLIDLLGSKQRCPNVTSFLSSYRDTSWSTIGNEAAFLIEGFIEGRYPPRLNSTHPRSNIGKIQMWWGERE